MRAGIEVVDGVALVRGAEAVRLRPRDTVCVTVDWPLPAEDSEEHVPADVSAVLCGALAGCGYVAFRCDEPPVGADRFAPPPRRSLAECARDWLLAFVARGEPRFGVATVSAPEGVAAVFDDGGWPWATQAALVFDPDADPEPMVQALGRGLDWRGRAWPRGARLLFGPGHDGAFAVTAAAEPAWLACFREALR